MTNTIVAVRCPDEVIQLLDTVCKVYGFTRAELLRTGAINYCQQLLITNTLEDLSYACHRLSKQAADSDNIDKNLIAEMDRLVQVLNSKLCVD